ncbi:endonuclease VII domain-containing protein [Sphaerisporangium sp. NBC_01403]|uniref:endonuclease VII domain-containing protein n=1 Tax=Sphaerisporangium sp. NBC_01403 TaxID=2903599 RepID=UPI003251BAE0
MNIDWRVLSARFCGDKCLSRFHSRNTYTPVEKKPAVCRICQRPFERKGNANTAVCSAECRKHWWSLKRRLAKYRITTKEYFALLAEQCGMCAICGSPGERYWRFELAIDHCHTTRKVRGLLCSRCNVGLGSFRDNPEFLRSAADYLERFESREGADCA